MVMYPEFIKRAEELGHKLKRDEDGNVDVFVVSTDYHNGPGCEVCHDDWCYHCTDASELKPCEGADAYNARVEKREREELARLKAKYEGEQA